MLFRSNDIKEERQESDNGEQGNEEKRFEVAFLLLFLQRDSFFFLCLGSFYKRVCGSQRSGKKQRNIGNGIRGDAGKRLGEGNDKTGKKEGNSSNDRDNGHCFRLLQEKRTILEEVGKGTNQIEDSEEQESKENEEKDKIHDFMGPRSKDIPDAEPSLSGFYLVVEIGRASCRERV